MDIANILAANPGMQLEELNTKSLTIADHTFYSFREVSNRFGLEVAREALGGLKAAAVKSGDPLLDISYTAMAGLGLDFANPLTIAQIEEMQAAGVWSEDVAVKLKSLGEISLSLIEQSLGAGVIATKQDYETAVTELARRQIEENTRVLVGSLTAQYNAVRGMLSAGRLETAKQIWEQGLELFK